MATENYADIINSLKFYFMLSITLGGNNPEKENTTSLNTYIRDLKDNKILSQKNLDKCVKAAYRSLSYDFLKMHNIEVNPDDRHIKIVEKY